MLACSHCVAGKLSVRPDRDMYSDLRYAAAVAESSVSCRLPSSAACRLLSVATSAVCCNSVREILFDLIHCYNPVWMRIALEANQRLFNSLGYREISREAHPGFDHPTSINMRKPL